jgi:hypothetical protein
MRSPCTTPRANHAIGTLRQRSWPWRRIQIEGDPCHHSSILGPWRIALTRTTSSCENSSRQIASRETPAGTGEMRVGWIGCEVSRGSHPWNHDGHQVGSLPAARWRKPGMPPFPPPCRGRRRRTTGMSSRATSCSRQTTMVVNALLRSYGTPPCHYPYRKAMGGDLERPRRWFDGRWRSSWRNRREREELAQAQRTLDLAAPDWTTAAKEKPIYFCV